MPFAAILGGGIGAIGSLIGGGMSASAASSAAKAQANAANQATQTQQQEFQQTQQNAAPFLLSGQRANATLAQLLGINGNYSGPGSLLLNPFQQIGGGPPLPTQGGQGVPQFTGLNYQTPNVTAAMFQASPGYNYELQQQQNAIQNSAAGKTGAISGNMLKALQGNAQGLASQDWWNFVNNYQNNYNNAYNANEQNALAQYNSQNQNFWNNYNAVNSQYWNSIGAYSNYDNSLFNMLNALSGQGSGAGANLGQVGASVAQSIGQNQIGAGNALAAGQIGSSNAIQGAIQGVTNSLTSPLYGSANGSGNSDLLQYLFGGGSGSSDFSGGGY